jgi:hypothetical protein
MSANHTPGPWTQGNAHGCGNGYAICAGACVVARVNGGGYPVGIGRAPESDANARLIAAAPDLLAALRNYQLLVTYLQRTTNPEEWATHGDWNRLQAEAAAAIARCNV